MARLYGQAGHAVADLQLGPWGGGRKRQRGSRRSGYADACPRRETETPVADVRALRVSLSVTTRAQAGD